MILYIFLAFKHYGSSDSDIVKSRKGEPDARNKTKFIYCKQ